MQLFITRQQHDQLLEVNNTLLAQLFGYKPKWSLAGVVFTGVPSYVVEEVNSILSV